jgi:tetratricopeptide (TPR) repeat protein
LLVNHPTRANDPLHDLGLQASQGAAAGYVADQGCRQCHADKYDSFQHVGMAQSMRRPSADVLIEDFDNNHYYHAPSQRHYKMHWDGQALRFERYQLDANGERINHIEQTVDWILGSGNRARSYLYQTPNGEIFQLPIGWYSQDGIWALSPGFEHAKHLGLNRPVRRECLFCHNAFPEVPSGSDAPMQAHLFPETMPEGIGCQRCHGPGAEHIRSVLNGDELAAIRGAIVNPRNLPVQQREQVCYQCHLLPSVAVVGVRRFDRNDFSFRPGQSLNDYLLHVDVDLVDAPADGRFEINHHAYRLRQSECFIQSEQGLSCLNCHDPHQKIARPAARDHFRDACLQCHERHKTLPEQGRLTEDGEDCVACHMPQRRTADVIHATMTDHRIARGPFNGEALVAPIEKTDPIIDGLRFYFADDAPRGAEAEIYKAVTLLQAGKLQGVREHLAAQFSKTAVNSIVPFLALGKAHLRMQAFEAAGATLQWVLERRPEAPRAKAWLGVALLASGNSRAAIDTLQQAIAQNPNDADAMHNLAMAHQAAGNHRAALNYWQQALQLRPNLAVAWFNKGQTLLEQGQAEAAVEALRQALRVEPSHTRAYVKLAEALTATGNASEAERVLQHAREHASEPQEVPASE